MITKILKISICLFLTIVLIENAKAQTIPYNSPCNQLGWSILWMDDFNTLDTAKWKVFNNDDHWGESRAVCLAKNVNIQNGFLKIDVIKENYQCPSNDMWYCHQQKDPNNPGFVYKYTGGMIESKEAFDFQYGYVEARIQTPVTAGLWGSFWTSCGTSQSNCSSASEIDILEYNGEQSSNSVHRWYSNIHLTYPPGNTYAQNYNEPNTFFSNFHIFGLYWNQSIIQIYCDGQLKHSYPNPGVHDPIKLLFDLFVGGSYHQSPLLDAFPTVPQSMFVDWVRVYKPSIAFSHSFKSPYLLNPKDDNVNTGKKQISVMWQLPTGTHPSTTCTISWGTSTNYTHSVTITDNTTTDHLYRKDIGNLEPETRYYYHINGANGSFIHYGDFLTPPANTATTTSFYATGSKDDATDPTTLATKEELAGEVLNQISVDPQSQTFLLITNGFVTANMEEFWRDEFFKNSNIGNNLNCKVPIAGGLSHTERRTACLDLYGNILSWSNPGTGHLFRKYLPFNYFNPYLNANQDFEYNHSLEYGPVFIYFPEIEYKNTSLSDPAITYIDVHLQNTTKEWKVLSFNFPVKSLNGDVLDIYSAVKQSAFDYGVQLVIMSHEDYYAHWVDDGIHFMIIGNGGQTTNGIEFAKIQNSPGLCYASTVPHFAKFHIDGDLMYVDVIQGADYNGYSKGRIIEQFAIPKKNLIYNSTVWNSGTYPIITDRITVYQNAHLQIESEVQLLENKRVKVIPGGKLTLTGNDAKLTSLNGYSENLDFVDKDANGNIINSYKSVFTKSPVLWTGIEVNSHPTQTQSIYSSGFSNQGFVVVENGATIENAKDGISSYVLVGQNNIKKGGGIIHATNAIFRNCEYGVKMYPYTNQNSSVQPVHDLSYFENCRFETTADAPNGFLPKSMMYLEQIYNLRIKGCEFENNTTLVSGNELLRGKGITAMNSSILVLPRCTTLSVPCGMKPNSFTHLSTGIDLVNSIPRSKYPSYIENALFTENNRGISGNTMWSLTVTGSDFVNNYRGIYLLNTLSAKLVTNQFTVPEFVSPYQELPYGLYLDGGKGFKIEENQFTISGDMACTRGIVVHNTGAVNNEIYNNTFNDLNIGIQAQFRNKGKVNNTDVGLYLLCNNFDNPSYDIWVAGKALSQRTGNGIATEQKIPNPGSQSDFFPAGNRFTISYPRIVDQDFRNEDADDVHYHYEANTGGNRYEPTHISSTVHKYFSSWNGTSRCQSKLGGGTLTQRYASQAEALMNWQSSQLIFDIWRNGGVETLPEQTELTLPWEAYQQFNELMLASPYLSEDAMLAMIDNPVFTSLMVKLVMVENPHLARNDAVMGAIYNRNPSLPELYIEEILDESGAYSPYDELAGNAAADFHLFATITEDIKFVYRTDTLNAWAIDSLIAIASRQPGVMARYELAYSYLLKDDLDAMNQTLTQIPNEFTLNEEETTNHENYLTTFAIVEDVVQNELLPGDLDVDQLTSLEEIMNANVVVDKSMALSLLKWNNPDYAWEELILIPQETSPRLSKPVKPKRKAEPVFKLYPNPARDYITIEYRTADANSGKLSLVICDAAGRKLLEKSLKGGDYDELVDISTLIPGVYSVQLVGEKAVLAAQKLTVIK